MGGRNYARLTHANLSVCALSVLVRVRRRVSSSSTCLPPFPLKEVSRAVTNAVKQQPRARGLPPHPAPELKQWQNATQRSTGGGGGSACNIDGEQPLAVRLKHLQRCEMRIKAGLLKMTEQKSSYLCAAETLSSSFLSCSDLRAPASVRCDAWKGAFRAVSTQSSPLSSLSSPQDAPTPQPG